MKDPKIIALRQRIGQEVTGDPEFLAADFVKLDPKEQIAITNLMKAEIATRPDDFTVSQVELAESPSIEAPEDFTLGDVVAAGVEGAGEGAKKFGSSLGGGLKLVLTLAAIASGGLAVIKLLEFVEKRK